MNFLMGIYNFIFFLLSWSFLGLFIYFQFFVNKNWKMFHSVWTVSIILCVLHFIVSYGGKLMTNSTVFFFNTSFGIGYLIFQVIMIITNVYVLSKYNKDENFVPNEYESSVKYSPAAKGLFSGLVISFFSLLLYITWNFIFSVSPG